MSEMNYETIFNILRQERSREELQPLNKSFYEDVLDYVRRKQSELLKEGKNGISSTSLLKGSIEFHNIKKILKELYERRERKIVNLAINKIRTGSSLIDTSTLLTNEYMFYTELVECLRRHKDFILSKIIDMPEQIIGMSKRDEIMEESMKRDEDIKEVKVLEETKQRNKKRVRFLTDIPQFLGTELEILGPFKRGDIAELEEEIVNLLLEKKNAELC